MTDFDDYKPDNLYFLPLGGASEFGGNLNLYAYNNQWLMVDCGIGFENQNRGEVGILLPDPSYIEQRRKNLLGLVITHAHEDHIGAVAHLWSRLRCPVYATPFAAAYIRAKMNEIVGAEDMPLHIIYPKDRFTLGAFKLHMLPVPHSIPEACMVEIETPLGRIIHTGDWKIDYAPMIGDPINERMFEEIGDKGVLAVIGDSTNAPSNGFSGDEMDVRDGLTDLFARLRNRIIVTCISRTIPRLRSIAEAAMANGRQVGLLGRSLWTAERISRELGYFDGLPPFVSTRKINKIPPDKLVLIATGSQGETNAALSRIAHGEHRDVTLDRRDHIVFSSRVIPPCAEAIEHLQDSLRASGVDLITRWNVPEYIYTSGHPSREDVRQMYQWLRPHILVPVHGETEHLQANAEIAKDCGAQHVVTPRTGGVVRLAPNTPEIVGHVKTGYLHPATVI